jgi:hypothetical protein
MQFKIVRHRDQDGVYHEGNTVQCLRRVREVTPDSPAGKSVQRVVAKFDRWARELPQDVANVLTEAELEEWRAWRQKQDESEQAKAADFDLDALPDRLRRTAEAIERGLATVQPENAKLMWVGLDAMSRALKKSGNARPKRPRGRPTKQRVLSSADVYPYDAEQREFEIPGTEAYRIYQKFLDDFARQQAQIAVPAKKKPRKR